MIHQHIDTRYKSPKIFNRRQLSATRAPIFSRKSPLLESIEKSQKVKGSAANLGHFAESYASGNAIGREKPSTEFVALSTFIARSIELSQIADSSGSLNPSYERTSRRHFSTRVPLPLSPSRLASRKGKNFGRSSISARYDLVSGRRESLA